MIYFHNITKNWYNLNCLVDAVEESDKGDDIKFTVRGNAQVFDLRTLEPDDAKDYEYVRREFTEYFKEFHEEEF